jgi:hypothetical protein
VCYTIPLAESPTELLELSNALRGHAGLLADAAADHPAGRIWTARSTPKIAERVEDYFIFQLTARRCAGGCQPLPSTPSCGRGCCGRRPASCPRRRSPTRSSAALLGKRDVTLVDWDLGAADRAGAG